MFSVVTAHILVTNGIYDYSVFDFSRSAFLLISGFLYANKVIDNKKDFIVKRILKILLPMWVWSFLVSILEIIANQNFSKSLVSFLITLLNLQGLNSIFFSWDFFSSRILPPISAYWFITVIFICYIILVFIKNTKIDIYIKKNRTFFFIFLLIIQITSSLIMNIQFGYLFSFFVGYALNNEDIIKKKNVIFSFITLLVFGFLRIKLHNCIDGSLLYNEVILPLFNNIAAVFITLFCLYLQNKYNVFDSLCCNKIYKIIENDSYYLFITHELFLYGTYRVQNFTNVIWQRLILFFVMTFVSIYILKMIINKISPMIYSKMNKDGSKI